MKRKQIGLLHWITSSLVKNIKKHLKDSDLVSLVLLCAQHLLCELANYTITGKKSHALQLDLNEAQICGEAVSCTAKRQNNTTFLDRLMN